MFVEQRLYTCAPGQTGEFLRVYEREGRAPQMQHLGQPVGYYIIEIGTLNHTRPEDIVAAARLVKKGKVISLALNFDSNGPQGAKSKYPSMGRINPVHTMLRTGTDAYSGVLDHRGIRAADDMVVMPLQCGTQWD